MWHAFSITVNYTQGYAARWYIINLRALSLSSLHTTSVPQDLDLAWI